ncbi:MAG: penicillin-binding protein [bacterium]
MPIPQLSYKQVKRDIGKKPSYYYSQNSYIRKRGKKRSFKMSAFIFFLKLAIIFFILGSISFAGLIWYYSKDLPAADKLIERDIALSTKIYDRSGEVVLYDIHGDEKRTMISLDDIPEYAKYATITAEDRTFYEHHGFNLKGILRALIMNSMQGTLHGQGGSTITQQLVKNAILSSEKTYARKLKELVLSYRIEEKFSKDEILKMYLNEIPYGSTVYGIEAAAQTFFGKRASNLTLAEAAILASLPRATTYYSPYGNHADKLTERQYYILDSMAEEQYISKEEAENAKKEKLEFKQLEENIIAPHFVMYIKELLAEKYGEEFMERNGLKVYTTLDLNMQKKAETAIANGMKNAENFGASNAALAAIDPKTGQILSMVGSRDYFDIKHDGNFNVALAKRQPGSSFKPIVYAALLEKGYTSETIFFDVVTNFKPKEVIGKDYIPHNYDNKEHGPVTVRKALQGSLNIPAVKALYLAGVNNVLTLAQKLGYTTLFDNDRFGLSLVLGGGEIKLLEHVSAYAVLAREGAHHPIAAILKIEDKDGKIIEEFKEKEKKILNAEIARKMNDMLSDDEARGYIFGRGGKLTLTGRPVCAKSGTTNDYKDAWTIGYTPSLAAGVWVGNNDNSEMEKGADGSKIAAPIWNEFMKTVLGTEKDSPVEIFNKPAEDIVDKIMLNGRGIYERKIKIDKKTEKLANDFCPEEYVEERTYSTVHSILYYVNKDDPRGDWPQNPASDPQFEAWENAIINWASSTKEFVSGKPPEEKCYLHNLENKPILNIKYPNDKDRVTSSNIEITINASAPRGIHNVDYYIDSKLAQTVSNYPFNLNYPSKNIANGFHTITVKAYDDVGNYNEQSIEINLMTEREAVKSYFEAPRQDASFFSSLFPLTFILKISDRFNAQSVKIISQKDNEQPVIIKTYNSDEILSDIFEFKWGDRPASGKYHFYAETVDKQGRYYKGQELIIQVL